MASSRNRQFAGFLGLISIILSALVFRAALLPPPPPPATPTPSPSALADDHDHAIPGTPLPLFGGNSGALRNGPVAPAASPIVAPRGTALPDRGLAVFAPARFQATPTSTVPPTPSMETTETTSSASR